MKDFPPLQQTVLKVRIMDTIHKKNGRLHIYVRQDKYKGELKSHNWVGRTYVDGKQKISSSGTTDLEKATSILEKWYDDLHTIKAKNNNKKPKIEDNVSNNRDDSIHEEKNEAIEANQSNNTPSSTWPNLSMFEKLKRIKFAKLGFGKKRDGPGNVEQSKQSKFKDTIGKFFKSKVSKMSLTSEEIVGIDITREAIRVAQVSKDKEAQWI